LLEGDELIGSSTTASHTRVENASSPSVSDASHHQRIVEDFVAAIGEGRRPICDAVEGRRSVQVIEAVYRSSRERRSVDI
jgi:UDP-N-acetyl-2-amino-2-deoxyglucuronate dehydrogenase